MFGFVKKFFFLGINIFIDFNKLKFVELCFNEELRI